MGQWRMAAVQAHAGLHVFMCVCRVSLIKYFACSDSEPSLNGASNSIISPSSGSLAASWVVDFCVDLGILPLVPFRQTFEFAMIQTLFYFWDVAPGSHKQRTAMWQWARAQMSVLQFN